MRRLVPLLALAAAVSGCATSPMMSTPFYEGSDAVFSEGAGDRVNLWPLYYDRAPARSVLWPLYTEADDHRAVRPFYSQYRWKGKSGGADEFNVLWPLCQFDLADGSNWVFPVFWSAHGAAVFPLYYDSQVGVNASETFWALAGLAGYRRVHGRTTWDWLLPLYARNEENFYSIPWSTERNGRLGGSNYFLAGLVGHRTDEHGKFLSSWALPFYYKDDETFIALLYGETGTASWTFPFYCLSDTCSANPLYVRTDDPKSGEGSLTLPLLLTYSDWSSRGRNSLYTLPYGWNGGGTAQTNTWWATPLVGTHGGRRTGWWAFPLYDCSGDPDFDEKAEDLGGETIPASVTFDHETLLDARGRAQTRVRRKGNVRADDEKTYLMLFDQDRHLSDRVDEETGCYRLFAHRKLGNRLLFNWESRSESIYDLRTRLKLDEKTSSDCSFLWRVFRYESRSHGTSRLTLFGLPVWH